MSTTVKEKIEREGITRTISEINRLEHKMRRILKSSALFDAAIGATANMALLNTTVGVAVNMVNNLKGLRRRTAQANSSEKRTVSSTKGVDVEALNSVYAELIGKFEELDGSEHGPLSYVKQNGMGKIERTYGIDLHKGNISFDVENPQRLYQSVGYQAVLAYQSIPEFHLLDTPRNRALTRDIVDAIVEELKTKARILEAVKRPI